MNKRLVILVSSLLLSIILLVTLVSPTLAAKATVRGKIVPVSYDGGIQEIENDLAQATGQYTFYADVNVQGDIDTFTLSITIRKLEPRALYVVGYVISRPYAGDVYYDVHRFASNRGTIKYTFQANEDMFYSDDMFMAYVDTDSDHADLGLTSDPVTLFPSEPTTPTPL